MAGAAPPKVRLEDVLVHFSKEEFGMLEKWQQDLYFDVLMESFESLNFIGTPVTRSDVIASFKRGERQNYTESQEPRAGDSSARTPVTRSDIIAWFKDGERQNCTESQESRAGDSSATGGGLGQIDSKDNTETSEPSRIVDSRFEEEMPWESPQRDEGMPHLEKVTDGLASPARSQDVAIAPKLHECHESGEKSPEKAKDWPCVQCDAAFEYQSDLVMHEESHSDEASCVSSAGAENCVCRFSLLLHFASQPEKSVESGRADSQEDRNLPQEGTSQQGKHYSCHQCAEQFKLKENLEIHYRYCYKERLQKRRRRAVPARYQEDGDKWVRKRSVPEASKNRPRPSSQGSSSRWTCSDCEKGFTSRYCLFKHRRRHKAEKRRSATEHNKSTSPASGFGNRAPVSAMKKLHECSECGKKFVFKRQLVTHMKAHAKKRRCQCPYCGESLGYKDRSGKYLHIHSGERAPGGRRQEDARVPSVAKGPRRQKAEELCQCAKCGKNLKKSYFPAHQAWHTGVRFMCLLCGRLSNFKSGGYRHLQHHKKSRDFSCPKCGARGQSKSCFCLIEKIHLGQEPLPALCNSEGMSRSSKDLNSCGKNKARKTGGVKRLLAVGARICMPKPPKAFLLLGMREGGHIFRTHLIIHCKTHCCSSAPTAAREQPQALPHRVVSCVYSHSVMCYDSLAALAGSIGVSAGALSRSKPPPNDAGALLPLLPLHRLLLSLVVGRLSTAFLPHPLPCMKRHRGGGRQARELPLGQGRSRLSSTGSLDWSPSPGVLRGSTRAAQLASLQRIQEKSPVPAACRRCKWWAEMTFPSSSAEKPAESHSHPQPPQDPQCPIMGGYPGYAPGWEL